MLKAQSPTVKRSNNKITLDGVPYYIHIVRQGETLYALSQAYRVPEDTIKYDNRLILSNGLQPNQYIKLRVIEKQENESVRFINYTVKKSETVYALAKRYHTTIDEIYKYNPGSELGISLNQVLKIPMMLEKTEPQESTSLSLQDTSTAFKIHIVEKKQTVFGIAALYKISQETLRDANPEIKEREIQPGDALRIPVAEENNLADDYYYHKVAPQETVWGISHLYQMKEKQLKKLNPEIDKLGLQIDMLIKIPKNNNTTAIFASQVVDTLQSKKEETKENIVRIDTTLPKLEMKTAFDTVNSYKVGFFLPLYLNMLDTSATADENAKIYPRSKLFVEFYEGALMALEQLKNQGVSFDIHVFDTQNDSLKTANILKNPALKEFDLFIGPVFGGNLDLVGDFAWENQINIVSPLSIKSSFIDHNPYAFQVSPPFEVQMKHASSFLNNLESKNYIVIHDGKSSNQEYITTFKQNMYAQMNADNFEQFRYSEVYYYDARDSVLQDVFTPGIENIVIVPSQNRGFVSDIMGKLNGYSYKYDLITFGQPRWLSFDNIELDNFYNTHTHLFSNSYIDYQKDSVLSFVQKFRYYYKNEPSKYAFQGYDITYYFCSALNIYGPEFRKYIHLHQPELLQTRYNFVPYTDQGGYQNSAIYILEYADDYSIRKVATYPRE